ncbi:radical SAM protein [Azohydromonas lata]|uniref:Radical SAM protein n=1 Tax=Azohydromonas lata TaxID=45677 RepID=A0ABU5ICP4_9BURK|nr:radical SAM protein [Azohydromonas lata]MDZ5456899.1 radical SAM protein [Azohydromonas lata]
MAEMEEVGITWELTYHCGLHCVMCPFTELSDTYRVKQHYLDREQSIKVAEDILRFPARTRVTLTGGEAMFGQHFATVYEMLSSARRVHLLTNAIRITEDQFALLEKYPPQSITISLDGPEEIHDRVRGHESAFRKSVANIARLRAQAAPDTRFKINCTINSLNIPHLSRLYDWCVQAGLDLQLQHLWFLDQQTQLESFADVERDFTVLNKHQFSTSQVDASLLDTLRQQLTALSGKVQLLPHVPDARIVEYYTNRTYFANHSCSQVDHSVRIDPYGNVTPCLGIPFGNLKERSLTDIYFSPMRKAFLDKVHDNLYAVCSRCCKNSGSALASMPSCGDMLHAPNA